MRIKKRALDPLACDRLGPFGLDLSGAARVESRRLGQLCGEDPFGALFREPRPRMKVELEAARAEIRIRTQPRIVCLGSDVRQESREQRAMDRLVADFADDLRQRLVPLPAQLPDLL